MWALPFPTLVFLLAWVLGQSQTSNESISTDGSPCEPNPCQYSGICHEKIREDETVTYRCACRKGLVGDNCEVNLDDCEGSCQNGAGCADLVDDFRCHCPFGFSGKRCENAEFWTLQQWTGPKCEGTPWRCFGLRLGLCVDTGFTDGNIPKRDQWYGRLEYDVGRGKYAVNLCFGTGTDRRPQSHVDDDDYTVPHEWCECENRYIDIPKLGRNSLGPITEGKKKPDSDLCHKLMKITASRLVNSSGAKDEHGKVTNIDCHWSGVERSRRIPCALLVAALIARAMQLL